MINKFKIKQISTYGFVLTRQDGPNTEYLNYDLDVVKLDVVTDKDDVIFKSLNAANSVLQTYNSKQLLDEMRMESKSGNYIIDNPTKGLNIKSIKFKYKLNKEGAEEMLGVNDESSSRV